MEDIITNLQTLKIEHSIDDINISSLQISTTKYGIIAIVANNHLFTPRTLSFTNFDINIHTTSILLKNNQLIMFEDTNHYMLQYKISTDYNIPENNIRQIITTNFDNITLYCVILYNTDIKIGESYSWNHLYDFIDSDIYKYTSVYKYLIDSTIRNMNHHLQKEIIINYSEINYSEINSEHIKPMVIKLYDIYKCLV